MSKPFLRNHNDFFKETHCIRDFKKVFKIRRGRAFTSVVHAMYKYMWEQRTRVLSSLAEVV